MSIQFRCQGCSQSLKVPDGSSGKKVRCPQCETINVIPEGLSEPAEEASYAPSAPDPAAVENPFAAPQAHVDPALAYRVGELTHQRIDMGDVLDQSWKRFKSNWIMAALFGLVFAGLAIGSGIVSQVIQGAAAVAGEPVIALAGVLFSVILQQAISAYQQSMGKRFGLNMVRGAREPLQGVFGFDKIVRILMFFVLFGLAFVVIGVVVAIPVGIGFLINGGEGGTASIVGVSLAGILGVAGVCLFVFAAFRLFLTVFFMVDRDAALMDAMSQSNRFMAGNGLNTFLMMFLVGIVGGIFGLVTCFVGFLWVMPFFETMQAMIYSKATGQYQNI